MAITTYDGLIAAMATAQRLSWVKATVATQGTAGYTSLWLATGAPLAGTIPTATGTTCTNSLTGTWPFVAGGANTTYLGKLNWVGATSHNLMLFDRLAHLGGLSGINTGTQVATLAIPGSRNAAADGSDVEWWVEQYTAIGITATTLTVTYTDENDGTQTCTLALGGASPLNAASRMFRILPTGSQYIKAIQSVRLTATTGTAGNFGVTCAKRLAPFPIGAVNIGVLYDFAQLGMPIIPDSGCLWIGGLLSTTSTGAQQGDILLLQG